MYDRYGIKPIIDIRGDWKDGELTRPLYGDGVDNIVTDERGSVFCVRGEGETVAMALEAIETKRREQMRSLVWNPKGRKAAWAPDGLKGDQGTGQWCRQKQGGKGIEG